MASWRLSQPQKQALSASPVGPNKQINVLCWPQVCSVHRITQQSHMSGDLRISKGQPPRPVHHGSEIPPILDKATELQMTYLETVGC